MPVRKAEALWKGRLGKGEGTITLGSGGATLGYSFSSRFENGNGSNPEELIGAALAGCFSMALSMMLEQAGFPPDQIHTTARVHIEKDGNGFSITSIDLDTEGIVPGCSEEVFQKQTNAAKVGCPVSKALASNSISLRARLLPTKAH